MTKLPGSAKRTNTSPSCFRSSLETLLVQILAPPRACRFCSNPGREKMKALSLSSFRSLNKVPERTSYIKDNGLGSALGRVQAMVSWPHTLTQSVMVVRVWAGGCPPHGQEESDCQPGISFKGTCPASTHWGQKSNT